MADLLRKMNEEKSERLKREKEEAERATEVEFKYEAGQVMEEFGKRYCVRQRDLLEEFGGRCDAALKGRILDFRLRNCEGEWKKHPAESNAVYLTEEGARRVRAEFAGKGVMKIGDVVTMEVERCNWPNKTLIRCRWNDELLEVRCGGGDHWKYVVGMKVPVKMESRERLVVAGKPRMRGKF